MGKAKEIVIKVIDKKAADIIVKRYHYSNSVVSNSVLFFGVFYQGKLEGAVTVGSPLAKKRVIGLVAGTKWNEVFEINRMAFSDKLPRNSESRALAIILKLIKKNAPHVKWLLSYADGTRCGDGTIYRAAGFSLTMIKKNDAIFEFPNGMIMTDVSLKNKYDSPQCKKLCRDLGIENKYRSRHEWKEVGGKALKGFMLRYIYFIDKSKKQDLTVEELPYSDIEKRGARMYKGGAKA